MYFYLGVCGGGVHVATTKHKHDRTRKMGCTNFFCVRLCAYRRLLLCVHVHVHLCTWVDGRGHLREDLLPNPHPHTSFDPVLLDAERSTAILKALRECGASPQKMMEVMRDLPVSHAQKAEFIKSLDIGPLARVELLRELPYSNARELELLRELPLDPIKKLEFLRGLPIDPAKKIQMINELAQDWG